MRVATYAPLARGIRRRVRRVVLVDRFGVEHSDLDL
jgi:hypothetical protein